MDNLERRIIQSELIQRREEGCDVGDIGTRIDAALADETVADGAFKKLYDELAALEPEASFPYVEPSELEAIRALRPDGPRRMAANLAENEIRDRIHGAWLGRAVGCSLGKPVEGWPRRRIDRYLESAGALPLDDYIPYAEGVIMPRLKSSTRDNIECMARDDDMDYPILGLLALESKGADFTSRTMADVWLSRMPFRLLYTAENAAYRNFVNGRWPPESAAWRNPFREWIGAQIRADIFGYATPGWPEKAAELAFRDASISHAKNGIYGEMFVAAMLAATFSTSDIAEIIDIGLSEIPANCRLAEAVRDTLAWCRTWSGWEEVWDRINQRYGHYHGVHTINNAALVVMGLMFGADDYQKGIVVAVRGGWDTDCNGATVGSILGARFGASELPAKWTGVLNDRLLSSVRDCNDNRISELAQRTHRIAMQMLSLGDEDETKPASLAEEATAAVPGNWTLNLPWSRHALRIDADFTGRIESMASGEIASIRDVRSDGNKVHFAFDVEKGGWQVEVVFDGRITGSRLVGQCVSGGVEFPASGVKA